MLKHVTITLRHPRKTCYLHSRIVTSGILSPRSWPRGHFPPSKLQLHPHLDRVQKPKQQQHHPPRADRSPSADRLRLAASKHPSCLSSLSLPSLSASLPSNSRADWSHGYKVFTPPLARRIVEWSGGLRLWGWVGWCLGGRV